jgi:hypothetical protein
MCCGDTPKRQQRDVEICTICLMPVAASHSIVELGLYYHPSCWQTYREIPMRDAAYDATPLESELH